jgi:hypothetical protein
MEEVQNRINERIKHLISDCFNNLNKTIVNGDDLKYTFVTVGDIVDAYEKVIKYYKQALNNIEQGTDHEELLKEFEED